MFVRVVRVSSSFVFPSWHVSNCDVFRVAAVGTFLEHCLELTTARTERARDVHGNRSGDSLSHTWWIHNAPVVWRPSIPTVLPN